MRGKSIYLCCLLLFLNSIEIKIKRCIPVRVENKYLFFLTTLLEMNIAEHIVMIGDSKNCGLKYNIVVKYLYHWFILKISVLLSAQITYFKLKKKMRNISLLKSSSQNIGPSFDNVYGSFLSITTVSIFVWINHSISFGVVLKKRHWSNRYPISCIRLRNTHVI